ncbi:MAG: hypothetical protein ACFE7R_09480 [Candidatus Hodarchaeota archaeon]
MLISQEPTVVQELLGRGSRRDKVREADLKQDRLTKHSDDSSSNIEAPAPPKRRSKKKSTRLLEINLTDFKTHPLWDLLVETARRNPLYPNLTGYTRDHVLTKDPKITPKQLASKLSISLGESIVILEDLRNEE